MDEPLYMDALITPHRSMSRYGFTALICVMTAINAAYAGLFFVMGAGPVSIFLALHVAALAIALLINTLSGRRRERVQVSAAQVRVVLETARGPQTLWASPTAFTRVELSGEARGANDLKLCLSGRALAVGTGLSRPERVQFASALDRAITRARTGGWD